MLDCSDEGSAKRPCEGAERYEEEEEPEGTGDGPGARGDGSEDKQEEP